MAQWQATSIIIGILVGITTLIFKWNDWVTPKLEIRKERREQCLLNKKHLNNIDLDIKDLKSDMNDIKDALCLLETCVFEGQRDSREYRKTAMQHKIIERYELYMNQGYITSYQLDFFTLCMYQYTKCIDDECKATDPVLTIYYPRIQKLEVRKAVI